MTHRAGGFTIVELLVTIMMVGIATAGISSLFISIQNIQRRASYADSATRAAQREIEILRNDNYAALTPGQTINFTSSLPISLPANRSGSAVVSQPTTDLRRVDVTISYTVGARQRKIILSSLIGTIGIAQ